MTDHAESIQINGAQPVDVPNLIDEAYGKPPSGNLTKPEIDANVLSTERADQSIGMAQSDFHGLPPDEHGLDVLYGLSQSASERLLKAAVSEDLGLSANASPKDLERTAEKLHQEMDNYDIGLPKDATGQQIQRRMDAVDFAVDGPFPENLPGRASQLHQLEPLLKALGLSPKDSEAELRSAEAIDLGLSATASNAEVQRIALDYLAPPQEPDFGLHHLNQSEIAEANREDKQNQAKMQRAWTETQPPLPTVGKLLSEPQP